MDIKSWMAWMGDVLPLQPVSREYRYLQTSLGDLSLSCTLLEWPGGESSFVTHHILIVLLFCSSLSILLIPFYLIHWTQTWVILNKNHNVRDPTHTNPHKSLYCQFHDWRFSGHFFQSHILATQLSHKVHWKHELIILHKWCVTITGNLYFIIQVPQKLISENWWRSCWLPTILAKGSKFG